MWYMPNTEYFLYVGHTPKTTKTHKCSTNISFHTTWYFEKIVCSSIHFQQTHVKLILSKQLTFLSISLSHISFMVQPAPLIMTAPRPNKPSISKLGRSPAAEAKAMLHVQGQYSSNHPEYRQ